MQADGLTKPEGYWAKRGCAAAVAAWLAFACLYVVQKVQTADAVGRCGVQGMGRIAAACEGYAGAHGGQLPTREETEAWAAEQTDAAVAQGAVATTHYAWAARPGQQSSQPTRSLAWCGAPHGLYRRWRNVLFDDLSVREVPEGEVAAMLGGHPVQPPTAYPTVGASASGPLH